MLINTHFNHLIKQLNLNPNFKKKMHLLQHVSNDVSSNDMHLPILMPVAKSTTSDLNHVHQNKQLTITQSTEYFHRFE